MQASANPDKQPGFRKHAVIVLWGMALTLISNLLFAWYANDIDSAGIAWSLKAAGHLPQNLGLGTTPDIPFWQQLLAGSQSLITDPLRGGQALSVLCLTLVCIPLFALCRGMFGRDAAAATLLLYALLPTFGLYASRITPEAPALLLALSALALCQQYPTRIAAQAGAGICVFAAWHVGATTAALLPLALVFHYLLARARREINTADFMAALLLLAVIPVTLALLSGALAPAAQLLDLAGGNTGLASYDRLYAELKQYEQQHISGEAIQNLYAITRHYIPVIYGLGTFEEFVNLLFIPNFVLALIGWRSSENTRRSREPAWAVILVCLFAGIAHLLRHNGLDRDLLLFACIATLPWAGLGLRALHRQRFKNQSAKAVAKVMIVLLFIASAVNENVEDAARFENTARKAGDWLQDQPGFGTAPVWSNDAAVLFFAGRGRGEGVTTVNKILVDSDDPPYLWLVVNRRTSGIQLPAGYQLMRQFDGDREAIAVYRRR